MALAAIPFAIKALGAGAATGAGVTGYRSLTRDEEPEAPEAAIPRENPYVRGLPQHLQEAYRRGDQILGQRPPPPEPEPEPPGLLTRAGDLAVSTTAAIPETARSVVGLANIPFDSEALAGVESSLARGAENIREAGLSDAAKAEKQRFAQQLAQSDPGFWNEFGNAIGAAVDNPWVTTNMLPSIIMQMVAGSKGAGALMRSASPMARAAVGEGAIAAGMASAEIGEEGGNRLWAAPIGAATAGITGVGGSLLNRMSRAGGATGRVGRILNAADPEQALAGGAGRMSTPSEGTHGNILVRMAAGALREGAFEELPQTIQEQVLQNIATGRDPTEGIGTEAGLGTLLGGVLGAGFNVRRTPGVETDPPPPDAGQLEDAGPAPPVIPPPVAPPVDETGIPPEDTTPRASPERVAQALDEQIPVTPEEEEAAIQRDEEAAQRPPLTVEAARTQIENEVGDAGRLFGNTVWQAVTDSLPEAPTQADVETTLDATRGIGDARKDRIRNTEWYQSLPPEPGAAPEPEPAPVPEEAVPEDVDPEGYEVEQGLRSIMNTAQVAGVPDPATGFERKPDIETKGGLRTLYRLIDNVGVLDTKYGKPTNQRGQAQRAAYVRKVVAENPEQYPTGLLEVSEQLHEDMKALASANSQLAQAVDNRRGRYGKAPQENLNKRQALVDRVEAQMRTFVDMVGENNVRRAMALGKEETRNKARTVTEVNIDRLASESKPALRFSTYFGEIVDGRFQEGAMSGRLIREEAKMAQRLGEDLKFDSILQGKTILPRVRNSNERPVNENERVRNLVTHFRFESTSPQGAVLFKSLDSTFRDKGLYDPEKLDIEVIEGDSPEGVGAAQFVPGGGNRSIGTIRVYADGRSQKALGHELIHAATVATIYDDPNLERPEHRNLLDIAQQLSAQVRDPEFAANYGEDAQLALTSIAASINSSAPDAAQRAVAEMAAYGLTDGGLQRWMRDTALEGESARTRTASGSTVWGAFVRILKRLVGAGAMKNSVFESFVRSSAVLMSKAETRSSLDVKAPSLPAPFEVNVSPETAAQIGIEAQRRAQQAYDLNREASRQMGRKIDESRAKAEQERRDQYLDMLQEHEITPTVGSAVPASPGAAARARGVTFIDRAAAGTMNSFAYAVSGSRHQTWESLTNAGYNGVLNRFRPLVTADPNNPLKALGGRIVGLVVDKANVPVLQQGLNHKLHRNTNVDAEKLARFSRLPAVMADFPTEGHQALMDFLDTDGGPDAVTELRNRTPESTAEMAEWVYQTMAHYRREALALGTITVEEAQMPMSSFLRDPKVRGFFFRTDVDVQRFKPIAKELEYTYAHAKRPVDGNMVITKDGVELFDESDFSGREFMQAIYNKDGVVDAAMVEVGTDASVMEDAGVTLSPDDYATYSLDAITGEGFRFSHRKTYAERRASNKHADAFVATAATAHELMRHVELNKLFRDYTVVNEQILRDMEADRAELLAQNPEMTQAQLEEAVPDHRWVRDTLPEELMTTTDTGERVPDSRLVFDLGDADVRHKVGSRNTLRIPGHWVYIPEGKKDKKLKPFDLGELEGKYMPGPAYAAVLDTLDPSPIISSRSLRAAQSTFKVANTVLSPVFYAHSLLSNVLVGYGENLTMSQIWDGFRLSVMQQWPESNLAKKYARDLGPVAAVAEESREMGILLGQARTEEFGTNFEQELAGLSIPGSGSIRDLTNGMISLQNATMKAAQTVETAKGMSSVVDNAFRNAKYMQQVAKWKDENPGQVVPEEVKLRAAELARTSFVDYNVDAPAIKLGRETIFPFVVFPYRWVGLLAKLTITQPWKVATMSATIGAMNGLMALLAGGPDNEEMQEGLQEWQRGNVWWMPGVDVAFRMPFNVAGNPTVWDMRTIVPGADFAEVNNSGIPDIFTPGGPIGVLGAILMNKDAFFGQEIWEETDSNLEVAQKMGKYVSEPFIPRLLRIAGQTYQRESGEEVGSLGQSRKGWTNWAKLLGVNANIVNMDEGRYNNARAREFILRDYNAKIRRYIRDETLGKTVDWEAVLDEVGDINQQMLDRLEEFDNG